MREEPPGGPERTSYICAARLTTYEAGGFQQKPEPCLWASTQGPALNVGSFSETMGQVESTRERCPESAHLDQALDQFRGLIDHQFL